MKAIPFQLGVASSLLALLLAGCGGGSSDTVAPPTPPASLQVSSTATDAFTDIAGVITLTASGQGNETVSWSLAGAGSLSASTGGSVQYAPPAKIAAASVATITATVKGLTQTINIDLHPYGPISLLAGDVGGLGNLDAPVATQARFTQPEWVAVDAAGNSYVLDALRDTLRKVAANGVVTTLAGKDGVSGIIDGKGTAALFRDERGLVSDAAGNLLVAEISWIRRVSPDGSVSTLVGAPEDMQQIDGDRRSARFSDIRAMTQDGSGGAYVVDVPLGRDVVDGVIRHVAADGRVTTLAITSLPAAPAAGTTYAMTTDSTGLLYVYAVSQGSPAIRVIRPDGVEIRRINLPAASSVLGSYPGWSADKGYNYVASGYGSGYNPLGPTLAVDAKGNAYLAVSDGYAVMTGFPVAVTPITYSYVLRVAQDGTTSVFAGMPFQAGTGDGKGTAARFSNPRGMTLDPQGNLVLVDRGNATLRRIAADGTVTTIAGAPARRVAVDGSGSQAGFTELKAITADAAGNVRLIDANSGLQARTLNAQGVVSSAARMVANELNTSFSWLPGGLSVDRQGNFYATFPDLQTVRKLDQAGVTTTFAGSTGINGFDNGVGTRARFNAPVGTAIDGNGNLYVADSLSFSVRKVTPDGTVSTYAGAAGANGAVDGDAKAARFGQVSQVTVDATGNVYVFDAGVTSRFGAPQPPSVRKISTSGVVTTLYRAPVVAESAQSALHDITGIAADEQGNVYLSSGKPTTGFTHFFNDLGTLGTGVIFKVSAAGSLSVVAGDDAGVRFGTALGALPGSLDYPVGITYLGKHRFAVAQQGAVLMLTLP